MVHNLPVSCFQPKCGSILELFPKGIYWKSYFGTLALTTGHEYASMYTGNPNAQQQANEVHYYQSNITLRALAKSHTIWVDPKLLVHHIQQLTHQWHSCCQQQQSVNEGS